MIENIPIQVSAVLRIKATTMDTIMAAIIPTETAAVNKIQRKIKNLLQEILHLVHK
jgi:hypothetical protein